MRVALIQMNSGRRSYQGNLHRSAALVERALLEGAKFVLLPEYFLCRSLTRGRDGVHNMAEEIPGRSTELFQKLAKEYKAHILLGSVFEKSKTGKKLYNTSVLVGEKGDIKASYRKKNLFHYRAKDQEYNEAEIFEPGQKETIAEVEGFTVGFSICFDLRFPKIYASYFSRGVDLIIVPSAFSKLTGQAHWEPLLRARAIENFSYVLAPAQSGHGPADQNCWGHSMAISPWGEVIVQAGQSKEEILDLEISRDAVIDARKRFPSLQKKLRNK